MVVRDLVSYPQPMATVVSSFPHKCKAPVLSLSYLNNVECKVMPDDLV
jgi:hypothetical protein